MANDLCELQLVKFNIELQEPINERLFIVTFIKRIVKR